jgi:hypothetical protein
MSAITKISARAKQIRRKHPGKSWKACIKAASAEYRAGSLGKASGKTKRRRKVGATLLIERNETRRTRPKRVVRIKRTSKGTFKGASLAGVSSAALKAELRSKLKSRLAMQLLTQSMATTKTNRRRAAKKVAETKRQLRKLD